MLLNPQKRAAEMVPSSGIGNYLNDEFGIVQVIVAFSAKIIRFNW